MKIGLEVGRKLFLIPCISFKVKDFNNKEVLSVLISVEQ